MKLYLLMAICAFLGGAGAQLALHSRLIAAPSPAPMTAPTIISPFTTRMAACASISACWTASRLRKCTARTASCAFRSAPIGAPGTVLPVLTLFDNSGRPKLTLTVNGANQSPTIVMRDNAGKDRLVFGLSPADPAESPFLATYDKTGAKTLIFR